MFAHIRWYAFPQQMRRELPMVEWIRPRLTIPIESLRLISTTHHCRNGSRYMGDIRPLDHKDFWSFTRGRFLSDESHQLSQRYVRFNIEELARLAEQAARVASPGSRQCVKIQKLADGMHNKALRFTMDNGFQVVGKVPNPNSGRPHFTTASEVATMDFV